MAPEWKPGQLADWELTRREAELEGQIKTFAPGSARATVLRGELEAVIAEQEDRKKVRAGSARRSWSSEPAAGL